MGPRVSRILANTHDVLQSLYFLFLLASAIGLINLVVGFYAGSAPIKGDWAAFLGLASPFVVGQIGVLLVVLRLFVTNKAPEIFELFWSVVGVASMALFTSLIVSNDIPCVNDGSLDCLWKGLMFSADQLSKGIFADVFDIFSLRLSEFSVDDLGGAQKYWVLLYRTYSGALFIELIMVFVRRKLAIDPSTPRIADFDDQ